MWHERDKVVELNGATKVLSTRKVSVLEEFQLFYEEMVAKTGPVIRIRRPR